MFIPMVSLSVSCHFRLLNCLPYLQFYSVCTCIKCILQWKFLKNHIPVSIYSLLIYLKSWEIPMSVHRYFLKQEDKEMHLENAHFSWRGHDNPRSSNAQRLFFEICDGITSSCWFMLINFRFFFLFTSSFLYFFRNSF